MTKRLAVGLALLVSCALQGQLAPRQASLRLGDSLLNLPTDRTLPPGTWDLRFTHRFAQPVNEGDFHSFWGLDGAADIGIGLAYGYREKLQVAIFRSDVLDNYEISAKYAAFRQSENFPLSLAARGGANWKTEKGLERRVAPFLQVIVTRQVSPRLEVFAVPTVSSRGIEYDSAFNFPVGAAWAIRPNLFLVAEVIPENRDAPDELHPGTAWAIGIKRALGGHFFEVLLTDSRATHVDQYAASIPLGGIREGDVHLGFNIGRRFGGRR